MRLLFKIRNKINYFLDKLFVLYIRNIKGIKIGKNCYISRKVSFNCLYGTLEIGDGCIIEPNTRLKIVQNKNNRDIVICLKSNVFVGYGSIIEAGNFVEIGKNTMIGPYVFISDGNHILKEKDVPIAKQGGVFKPTIIEENVWIGTQSQILSGAIVGANSIVAANSTVIDSLEKESLITGIPAKVKKKLFERYNEI